MRKVGWIATLSLATIGAGLWLAPLLVALTAWALDAFSLERGGLTRVIGILVYEVGLLAPALLLAVASRRLGWLERLAGPIVLLLSPSLGEAFVMLVAGARPLVFTSLFALSVRVVLVAAAIVFVSRRARPT